MIKYIALLLIVLWLIWTVYKLIPSIRSGKFQEELKKKIEDDREIPDTRGPGELPAVEAVIAIDIADDRLKLEAARSDYAKSDGPAASSSAENDQFDKAKVTDMLSSTDEFVANEGIVLLCSGNVSVATEQLLRKVADGILGQASTPRYRSRALEVLLYDSMDSQDARRFLDYYIDHHADVSGQTMGITLAFRALPDHERISYADRLVELFSHGQCENLGWVVAYASDTHGDLFRARLEQSEMDQPDSIAVEYFTRYDRDYATRKLVSALKYRVPSHEVQRIITRYYGGTKNKKIRRALVHQAIGKTGTVQAGIADLLLSLDRSFSSRSDLWSVQKLNKQGIQLSKEAVWLLDGITPRSAVEDFVDAGLIAQPSDDDVVRLLHNLDFDAARFVEKGPEMSFGVLSLLLAESPYCQQYESYKPDVCHEEFLRFALNADTAGTNPEAIWLSASGPVGSYSLCWIADKRVFSVNIPDNRPVVELEPLIDLGNSALISLGSSNRCIAVAGDDYVQVWVGDPSVLWPLFRKFHMHFIEGYNHARLAFRIDKTVTTALLN